MNETRGSFIIGLDLGQSRDYTALVVVERLAEGPPPRPQYFDEGGGMVCFPSGDERPAVYHVRHIERFPLGTLYPAIVQRVVDLLRTPPLTPRVPLVVDRTGVGAAVADLFTLAATNLHAVTITGGDDVIKDGSQHTKVPKRELIGTLIRLFQTEALKIAEALPLAHVLTNELLNFRLKVNLASGHDSYEAWREGDHDDVLLALALAAWYGEKDRRCALFWA